MGERSPVSGAFHFRSRRFAKGSVSAVHLIHRGAVPLPLKGKDNSGAPGMGINLVVKVHYALGSRKR